MSSGDKGKQATKMDWRLEMSADRRSEAKNEGRGRRSEGRGAKDKGRRPEEGARPGRRSVDDR